MNKTPLSLFLTGFTCIVYKGMSAIPNNRLGKATGLPPVPSNCTYLGFYPQGVNIHSSPYVVSGAQSTI